MTPQTERAAYMAKKMPKVDGLFLQAESEVAAINMVYGAAVSYTHLDVYKRQMLRPRHSPR